MRFSPAGKRRRAALALGIGSLAYFFTAVLTRGTNAAIWLPWLVGLGVGLATLHAVRMLLVWAYLKRGLGSDDSLQVEELKQQRTRDDAHLIKRPECRCSLIFFQSGSRHGFDTMLINLFTGLDGYSHVAIDCCFEDEDQRPWILESTHQENITSAVDQKHNPDGLLSGPQLAPNNVYNGRFFHRLDISDWLDCEAFCACLIELVKRRNAAPPHRPSITHKIRYLDLMYGVGSAYTVTCSGLVERCARTQKDSRLASMLRQQRETKELWGELTPNDLIEALYAPADVPDPIEGPP